MTDLLVYNAAMVASTAPGPLERTVVELGKINRAAHFRGRHVAPARTALRHSDLLMTLIEETVASEGKLVPAWLWSAVTKVVAGVDTDLRDELGINRRAGHVAEILFRAQASLMQAAHVEALPRMAPIIPLFRT
jgi:hypothetical protein